MNNGSYSLGTLAVSVAHSYIKPEDDNSTLQWKERPTQSHCDRLSRKNFIANL
jgi:hypothetical protein